MDILKLLIATIMAVLSAAIMAIIVWPQAMFAIWLGLVTASLAALWFHHRRWPEYSLLTVWRDLLK